MAVFYKKIGHRHIHVLLSMLRVQIKWERGENILSLEQIYGKEGDYEKKSKDCVFAVYVINLCHGDNIDIFGICKR